jgi:hypothetical protein
VSTTTKQRVGLWTSDVFGHVWYDDTAAQMFGVDEPTSYAIPQDAWAAAFHCYHPVTRMPMSYKLLPAARALEEGRVITSTLLIAPPDKPEVIARCTAKPLRSGTGEVLGVVVVCYDITERWLERVGARKFEVDYTVSQCPCEAWQVDAPTGTPISWIQEAVVEHMGECLTLAAVRRKTRRMPGSAAGAVALALGFAILHMIADLGDMVTAVAT